MISLDLISTFVASAGGDAAQLTDLDGVNIIPFVTGKKTERPYGVLYWKKEVRAVTHQGDWKLMRHIDRPAELYNIANDISETNILASQYPDKIKFVFKSLYEWKLTLDRLRWLLDREYEKVDIDRMNQFRNVPSQK